MTEKSANCVFKLLICFTWFFEALDSVPIDNDVEGVPEIACLSESVKIAIQTAKPFFGHVYVKGQFRIKGCHLDLTNLDQSTLKAINPEAARPTVIYEVPYGGCVVKRERTINPAGLKFTMSVVVQFHRQFLTKVDRAYTITCFYMESMKTVTFGLDVSMIDTTQLYQTRPMPVCSYDVLRNGLTGPVMRFAQVGEMAFHKWSCQGVGVYGILVHSCSAADGTGEEYKLIDSRGCAIDPVIVNDVTYTPDLNMAYVEVHVFKFADRMQLSIQCQVSLCLLNDGGCDGITPPICDPPAHQTNRHAQPPTPRVARPPAIQPGNPPSIAPILPYAVDQPTKASASSYPATITTLSPYVVFPTPPPSGPYLNGYQRRLRRRPANVTGESNKVTAEERRNRFERTIDLATDDIFIFNLDDQIPIDSSLNGIRHRYNQTSTSSSSAGPEGSPATCTSTVDFILSLLGVALLSVSASAALGLYQRRVPRFNNISCH